MNPYHAELIGTTILIANVVKGNNAGWIVITAGWGLAVSLTHSVPHRSAGAHLNPAVTIVMSMSGKLGRAKVGGHIMPQMVGGIVGAGLVFFYHREHFKASADADAKLACALKPPDQVERGE
jgi:glycerol uptake facilitator protein